MATLTIRDTTPAGLNRGDGGTPLTLPDEVTTVRELLRARIYQEVDDHNRRLRAGDAAAFRGLVTPGEREKTLNPQRTGKASREVDWQAQFDAACRAFEANGFFILIDDEQPTELDEQVTLREGGDVSFVKLTPLIGG